MPEIYEKRKNFQSVLKSPECFDELFNEEN
jgi:hypothetical protein